MGLNNGRRRTRTYTAVLVATLALASPAAAQSDRVATAVATLVDISKIHIDNFGRVDANFYRGAQPKDRDYSDLAALGVKTLINLTSSDRDVNEESLAAKAGLKYVQIPMTTRVVPTAADLAAFMQVATDPASQPIYVHCVGGRHRTGVMTAVYRMTHDGWSADQAFKEMKQYKFGADMLHPEFKQFVYGYAATLANHVAAPVLATSSKTAPGTK